MMVFKKKQIIAVSMAVALAVAGYINWAYFKDIAKEASTVSEAKKYGEATYVNTPNVQSGDYFTESKIKREKARSESLEILKSVSEDKSASAESRNSAQQEIIRIAKATQGESAIENQLSARGFEGVFAQMSENGITVAVKANGLTPPEIARIRDVVTSETGLGADKIKVIEVK